ncbi:MAG TPA: FG-GAP-like repeat-containing protein [Terriglobales bacterium]|jgi:tetratricopeptide (TPR) repeat protein
MTARVLTALLIVIAVIGVFSAAPTPDPKAEAARLNSIGVAYMNQQLFEKALKYFEDASKLDPKLSVANINQGIAQLNLGRVPQAKEILESYGKLEPKDPRVWYNLGLLYKNSETPDDSINAFHHVVDLDSNDVDSWYFLGAAYSQAKQFPQAIDAFDHALKLNPLHASAQFGISRAYQQSGDTAHAREHLVRFQYITQNKLGAPISLAYGEQGKYSLVEESPAGPPKVLLQIDVKFVDETKKAGLTLNAQPATTNDSASFMGPGACFLDYDADGKPDLFLSDSGKEGGISLFHNIGGGKFLDGTKNAGLDPSPHGIGCTAGDYDNDGFPDIVVTFPNRVLLWHNEKNGTFKSAEAAAGIAATPPQGTFNLSATFIDYDHDGDLDLVIAQYSSDPFCDLRRSEPSSESEIHFPKMHQVWRNNGNGTFTDQSDAVGISNQVSTVSVVGSDYNNDRAVDIVMSGWYKLSAIFENPREGKFVFRSAQGPGLPTLGVNVFDFDHDGWMDIAFAQTAAPGVSLWRNNQGKTFDEAPLPSTDLYRAFGLAAFDYDNDGWVDLAAVGETKDGKGEIKLFRNLGPDGFKDVTSDVGLDKIQLKDPRALVTADYDNDGDTDLLITQNHGPAILLRNDGGNKNHWMRLSLKGLNDNKSAIGTKIEVFSGGNRQKFEIAGSSGYLGQNSTDIVVGLGDSKQADVVRMLWPTGVLQDEIEVAGDKEQKFLEIDRRGSSCPTLFVWDGHHYQLVGDMLGAGVVGHWVGPNERNIPRPTEYIKIDRNAVVERDGKLSFRFMEPLEEVVYLDHVKLLTVDHPANIDVYPNEYFASNPPYPEFKVVASQNPKPPAAAHDEHGHDVLPDLLAHRFFGDFELLPFAGFAKPHMLELDLGDRYNGGPLWLLMHGEIEYFTATSMYAADQAGIQPFAPYVEALGSDGKWKRVIDDMGFPAGGARTMTANLTGKLPPGTKQIRITTNLQVYWDSILISRTSQDQVLALNPVPLARADLSFHGFPRKIENQPPGNVEYIYEQVSATGPYTRPAGPYTRYGDVLPLLGASDDRLAVFGSGDQVALEFDPSKLPSLPKGWVRDYFFMANGYEKDMDFYAFKGDSVDPMPFGAMGTYPYPEGKYPIDSHLDDLVNYNTRYMSGNESRGYAFNYAK